MWRTASSFVGRGPAKDIDTLASSGRRNDLQLVSGHEAICFTPNLELVPAIERSSLFVDAGEAQLSQRHVVRSTPGGTLLDTDRQYGRSGTVERADAPRIQSGEQATSHDVEADHRQPNRWRQLLCCYPSAQRHAPQRANISW